MIQSIKRLAVISDIHGNLPALQTIAQELKGVTLEGWIVAGDLVTGPQQNEVLQLLQTIGCWTVLGNNDEYMLRHERGIAPEYHYTRRQFDLVRASFRRLDRASLDFLRTLPTERIVHLPGTDPIRVVHGSPGSISELVFPDRDPSRLEQILSQIDEPVLICGHTHLPWIERRNGKLALNPGAVCGGLNGISGAQYAIMEWRLDHWEAELKVASYDLSVIEDLFLSSGLLAEGGGTARAFMLSILTGRDIVMEFVNYACQLAEHAGFRDLPFVPDPIWIQAEQTFHFSEYESWGKN